VAVRARPLEDVGLTVRVLVTGHDGYIGVAVTARLLESGHDVLGLDTRLYSDFTFGPREADPPSLGIDIRDVKRSDLAGFDAVVHLAALSNDPIGSLSPDTTYEVNHLASVRLAALAKQAGVSRFAFSSSCSLYGAAGDELLDEHAPFNPVAPYGQSKVLAETGISELADDAFSPTFLRNATAYGITSRLRGDLVLNNLVGLAFATGGVLIRSDGTPWRPLVHVEDIARAFVAVLEAPRELVHDEAFNVGRTEENYRISELGALVEEVVPGSRVVYAPGGGPDLRAYRVSCEKIRRVLPSFRPAWTARLGAEQLYGAFLEHGLTREQLEGPEMTRLARIRELRESGLLDASLRRAQARTGRA
jgi:nucleoside-diphosphate-sugar epimerase